MCVCMHVCISCNTCTHACVYIHVHIYACVLEHGAMGANVGVDVGISGDASGPIVCLPHVPDILRLQRC